MPAESAMRLTIQPTEHFFLEGDVTVRLWMGHDAAGQPCIALVTAVGLTGQETALSESLVPIPPPTPEDARRWAESIMGKGDAQTGR